VAGAELGPGRDVGIKEVLCVAFHRKAGRGTGVLDSDIIFKPLPEGTCHIVII